MSRPGLRSKWALRLLLLACPVMAAGAAGAGQGGGKARCLDGTGEALETVLSQRSGLSVAVPGAWERVVREHADCLVVEDGGGGCSLDVVRSPAVLSLEETVRLYEGLYFGGSRIRECCLEELRAVVRWPEKMAAGEYEQKASAARVRALYALLGEEMIVAWLTCPARQRMPSWVTTAAIFASIRRLVCQPVATRLP